MRTRGFWNELLKLFKSRFFVILLSVAVFLTVLPATLAGMGRTDLLRSGVNIIASPLRALASATGSAFKGFSDYFTEFERLRAENERLKQELAEANKRLDNADIATAENEWLRKFLLYSVNDTELLLIDAVTVGSNNGALVTYFTLNKGTSSGVDVGMPVISESGLVGYVCEAGLTYSKVRTIICDDTSAGAFCERSAVYGTIEGNYSFLADGKCKMTCDDAEADLKEGDVIVTSGQGAVYPYGLAIGKITKIEKNTYSRKLTAYIEPYHDFSESGRVMIIATAHGGDVGE